MKRMYQVKVLERKYHSNSSSPKFCAPLKAKVVTRHWIHNQQAFDLKLASFIIIACQMCHPTRTSLTYVLFEWTLEHFVHFMKALRFDAKCSNGQRGKTVSEAGTLNRFHSLHQLALLMIIIVMKLFKWTGVGKKGICSDRTFDSWLQSVDWSELLVHVNEIHLFPIFFPTQLSKLHQTWKGIRKIVQITFIQN